VKRNKEDNSYIIAYKVHPKDQISVLASMLVWLGQSHNSGARKGAEQCSAAHSYNHQRRLISEEQCQEIKMRNSFSCWTTYKNLHKRIAAITLYDVCQLPA